MVVPNMDGPMRDQVLKLIDEKQKIESEISNLGIVLERNRVGMSDSLVDGNGFPRNDIDVYQVRHARHKIICLQNDHKALMKQIEKGLHALHSSGSVSVPTNFSSSEDNAASTNGRGSTDSVTSSIANLQFSTPRSFAKINYVSGGSPAEDAGVRVNDEIIEFGSLNASNYRALTQISEIVQHSIDKRVNLKVLRGTEREVLNIILIPHAWSGRGHLGCNIVPIVSVDV